MNDRACNGFRAGFACSKWKIIRTKKKKEFVLYLHLAVNVCWKLVNGNESTAYIIFYHHHQSKLNNIHTHFMAMLIAHTFTAPTRTISGTISNNFHLRSHPHRAHTFSLISVAYFSLDIRYNHIIPASQCQFVIQQHMSLGIVYRMVYLISDDKCNSNRMHWIFHKMFNDNWRKDKSATRTNKKKSHSTRSHYCLSFFFLAIFYFCRPIHKYM